MIGKYLNIKPEIDGTCFIAPGARVVGAVKMGEHSSLWYNTVVRADLNEICIGKYSNIQDGSVLHVEDFAGVSIGDHVTVGHSAVVHACTLGDYSLIGMGAVVLNRAEIGEGAKVAAGAVVCENFVVPPYTLVMGVPAKIKRELTEEEIKESIHWAKKYAELSKEFIRTGIVGGHDT